MLKIILKIAVSAGLIAWLISRTALPDMASAMRQIGQGNLLAAAIILIAITPLLTWRWNRIARAQQLDIAFRQLAKIVLIGNFFNQVLPSAIGGDAVRILLLGQQGVPASKALVSIFADRLCALLGMLLIALCGYRIWSGALEGAFVRLMPWLPYALLAGALVLAALWLYARRRGNPLSRAPRVAAWAAAFTTPALDLARRPLLVAEVVGISVLIHVAVAVVFWLFASALNTGLAFGQIFVCAAIALILSVLPISAAGWGVREGTLAYVLVPLGVAQPQAIAISVAFGLASILSGIPGLLLWLIARNAKRGDVGAG